MDVCQKVGEVAQDKFATRNPQLSMRHPNSRSLSAEYFIGLFKPTRRFAYLRLSMRLALAAFRLVICATMAMAQTKSEDTKLGDSPSSDGRVVLPDNKGQPQPRAGPARSRPASAVRQQQVHGGHAASHATRAWRCDYDDR